MAEDSNPRSASAIDKFIGAQIRVCRSTVGLSQEALAEAIGVTFQQIQKYEKGVNRVSAAALLRIAQALDVEVSSLMPSALGKHAGDQSGLEMIAALSQPLARLNAEGREVLVVLARALATHPRLRA